MAVTLVSSFHRLVLGMGSCSLKPASLGCKCPSTEHFIIALFPGFSQPFCLYSAFNKICLSSVIPGGAGAPQPGQRWDQQAGAAAGCEKCLFYLESQPLLSQPLRSHSVAAWKVICNVLLFVCGFFQDARSSYRRILTDSARKLNAQGSQLGACIEKARPYYEARRLAKEVRVVAAHEYSVYVHGLV